MVFEAAVVVENGDSEQKGKLGCGGNLSIEDGSMQVAARPMTQQHSKPAAQGPPLHTSQRVGLGDHRPCAKPPSQNAPPSVGPLVGWLSPGTRGKMRHNGAEPRWPASGSSREAVAFAHTTSEFLPCPNYRNRLLRMPLALALNPAPPVGWVAASRSSGWGRVSVLPLCHSAALPLTSLTAKALPSLRAPLNREGN